MTGYENFYQKDVMNVQFRPYLLIERHFTALIAQIAVFLKLKR
jgi:hypothetical protein